MTKNYHHAGFVITTYNGWGLAAAQQLYPRNFMFEVNDKIFVVHWKYPEAVHKWDYVTTHEQKVDGWNELVKRVRRYIHYLKKIGKLYRVRDNAYTAVARL